MSRKTLEELKALSDIRLLAYYKAERKRLIKSFLHKDNKARKDFDPINIEYVNWLDYLDFIKTELNTRNNVSK